ncbi:head-tail connector protein [Candidatus Thiothrix sp. Deng01]|uniref:Head-tail connector protein n=1 Tax=Candidatus Thiothrix phosphatis TaxID=3112415 RepID=A0ABU6CVD3_9GAMM|nr:head-tail connector protein [Candidatus Thiothrix sp. Deng01]MEB4590492.1 head-tail connector protein [Candidatus Thiothrix sp. Deng01]
MAALQSWSDTFWKPVGDYLSIPASLSLAAAKLHLRIDHDDDDASINAYILAACAAASGYCGRPVLPQYYDCTLSDKPLRPLLCPPGTYQVANVMYMAADGSGLGMMDGNQHYYVEHGVRPLLVFRETAPAVLGGYGNLAIRVAAGFDPLPHDALVAILMMVGTMYENRETVSPLTLKEYGAVQLLLDRHSMPVAV